MIFLSKGNKHVFPRIFAELARREGQSVTLPTLVSLTGYTPDQIKLAINNARKTNPDHASRIEVVKAAREWKFNAVPEANGTQTLEKVMEEVEMGSPHIWKHTLAVLAAHPGEILSKEFIAEEINKAGEVEMTPDRVATSMDTILRRSEFTHKIEVIWSRRSWRFKGKVKPAPKTSKNPNEEVSPSIRSSVLRYFVQRPGELLFADDIASDLGFTRKQVQSAVYSMATEDSSTVKNDFTIVQAGQSWRYAPSRATSNGRVTPALTEAPATSYAAPVPTSSSAVTRTPVATATKYVEPKPLPRVAPEPTPTPAPALTPAPARQETSGRLFEEIGQTTDGDVLVREADSKVIYRATPLA